MVFNTGNLLFLALVVAAAVNAQDYCRICQDHTMCRYRGFGSKCLPRIESGVTETAKAAILNAHNAFRQRVAQGLETKGSPGPQPPAANMRVMSWSPELAKVAQRWADQCDFKMDSCRSTVQFTSVGQAIYRSSTTGSVTSPDWAAAVTKWYDHVKDFDKASITPYRWNNAGLYSQVVWAETHQVGCGYTVHKERGDDRWTHQFYVCNYGPAGNIAGGTMYKTGRACTKCPPSTTCNDRRYPSLCS